MTQVITRFFDSETQALAVQRALLAKRVPRPIIRVFTNSEGLVEKLTAEHVMPETAEAYQWRVEEGGAVILVNAGIKPLGVAQMVREITAEMGASDLGNVTEEVYVKDDNSKPMSVMNDHRLFMTRFKDPNKTNYYMADWPIPLISKRKPYTESVFKPHARMAEWPIPLTARMKPRDEFAFPRHARMANLIFPLTIRRKPSDNFIFPRHSRMANAILPLTNRRKPFSGTWIGRHRRMANWPFPHLINGKTGTNALMPGAPRMAAGPMDLISRRKPADKFAFPRHARMAKLFLPLLSKRKPITASIFPRHARMADLFLPLVIRKAGASGEDKRGSWFSRKFGLPTVIRR